MTLIYSLVSALYAKFSGCWRENRDTEIGGRWVALLSAVWAIFQSEHPDAVERLKKLAVDHNQVLSG